MSGPGRVPTTIPVSHRHPSLPSTAALFLFIHAITPPLYHAHATGENELMSRHLRDCAHVPRILPSYVFDGKNKILMAVYGNRRWAPFGADPRHFLQAVLVGVFNAEISGWNYHTKGVEDVIYKGHKGTITWHI